MYKPILILTTAATGWGKDLRHWRERNNGEEQWRRGKDGKGRERDGKGTGNGDKGDGGGVGEGRDREGEEDGEQERIVYGVNNDVTYTWGVLVQSYTVYAVTMQCMQYKALCSV